MEPAKASLPAPRRAYLYLGTLVAAYIGIYLCRKNLSVAVPILQKAWGLNKEQVGIISSVSTIAYAAGKFLFGPLTDRLGGRRAMFLSMSLVAVFCAASGWVPSLAALTALYSANRLSGSACWGAILKQVPEWFGPEKLAFACGLLSLSYVFGGAIAMAFAGLLARWTHDSWPAVLAGPSLALLGLVAGAALILPRPNPPTRGAPEPDADGIAARHPFLDLVRERRFLVVIALSFTLTLLRETFNFWTVDFLRTEAGPQLSNSMAALLSTPFDLCGALGIVLMGWVFGRISPGARQRLLMVVLVALSLLLLALPTLFHLGLWALALGVGLIGFLVYGPYSLLGGVLSVEVRGQEYAATVSGLVDGTGYIAGVLSGMFFGRLLMLGGYRLGFEVMAGLTLVAAMLSGLLYGKAAASPQAPDPLPAQSSATLTDS